MVKVLDPGNTGINVMVGEDLGYRYPLGLDLTPGSKLHGRILQEVLGRARDSQAVMRERYESWKLVDQAMTAYVPDSLEFNQNLGTKEEIRVIVPMGFAVVDTLISHVMSIYTGGPLFPLRGVGPEDKKAAMLAELVLDRQVQRSKMLLNVHTQLRDAFCYGMGVVSPCWKQQWGYKVGVRDAGAYSAVLGGQVESGIMQRTLERKMVWEGNELENWSVYGYLPDPNRAVHDVQKMQFVGNAMKSDYYELMEWERDDPETYFNVRYLEARKEMVSEFLEGGEWANGLRDAESGDLTRRIDLVSMYCKLIPKDWGLGKSEYPEIWLFTVAGDMVVVRAQPVTYAHNEYPVLVMAPSFDGYSTAPMSVIEGILPSLRMLDWYFRSHFHNVRKSLNNMFLIDPYLVRYDQAATPEPGKLICLREHVWGRGVKDAMVQLNTTDVTRTNVNDAAIMMDMIERVSGAVTQLQGVTQTKGERRSATESRDTRLSALSRITKQAMMMSLQSMGSLGRQCLFNTQQFMEEALWVELTGRHQLELSAFFPQEEGSLLVGPEDIIADMDVVVEDPSSGGGEFLTEMMQMYQLAVGNQETFMAFDSVRMMLHLMKMSGTQNPTQFLRDGFRMELVPSPEVLAQAQGGQIKPLGTAGPRGEQNATEADAQRRSPATGIFSDVVQEAFGNG